MNEENKEESNPFKKGKMHDEWPSELLERFKMRAERTGESLEVVIEAFIKYIADEHGCEDWKEESTDLLIDWGEMQLTETRRSTVSGAGANTVTFVGSFVGVDAKEGDRRANFVRNAIQSWKDNSNAALSDGKVGHYLKEGDVWVINTSNGVVQTEDTVEEAPTLGIKVESDYICMLNKAGRPYPPTLMGRHYYFLGNEKAAFVEKGEIDLWRVDLTGENRNLEVLLGKPCTIEVRLPTTTHEAYKDILNTNFNFDETMDYTDDFVKDDLKKLLDPFTYWINEDFVGEQFVPLEELMDAYDSRRRTFTGRDNREGTVGPIVFTRGTVSRMSTEARENQFDEDGRGYSLSLTSLALQNIHGKDYSSEVTCWIGSACNDLTSPFTYEDENGEQWGYAEKSRVVVCGRIGVSSRDGNTMPNIRVLGVYTNARRSRRRVGGGDTGSSQFE